MGFRSSGLRVRVQRDVGACEILKLLETSVETNMEHQGSVLCRGCYRHLLVEASTVACLCWRLLQ